jgi:hypothetical protein
MYSVQYSFMLLLSLYSVQPVMLAVQCTASRDRCPILSAYCPASPARCTASFLLAVQLHQPLLFDEQLRLLTVQHLMLAIQSHLLAAYRHNC